MGDNGNEEEQKVKYCPIVKEYCIKERCVLYSEMMRVVGGVQQKFNMCVFAALLLVVSEMNAKAQAPQQKIQLPGILRG